MEKGQTNKGSMDQWTIDINCDLGEGLVNEEVLFPYISSCNIACGGHAGDWDSMSETVALAQSYKLAIGAHPSYPDREGFGRSVMEIGEGRLKESIREQLGSFDGVLKASGAQLHHIKAHGALYNQTAKDSETARTYLEAIMDHRDRAFLFVPYGSVVSEMAEAMGFGIRYEAFADRNYRADLTLVPRGEKDAMIWEPANALAHILPMIKEGRVSFHDGGIGTIVAQTLCVHSDGPTALEILMYLSRELPKHRVKVQQ